MEAKHTTFKYAVYKFLIKSNDKSFSNINYDQICDKERNNDSSLPNRFENIYKAQSKNFNTITRLLAICGSELFYEENNVSKNLCNFSDNAMDFIAELLFKYNSKDSVWKAIKKIDNTNYDGFLQAYKKVNDRKKYISEVEFLINGFLGIAKDKFSKNSIKYNNLREHLIMITQFSQLKWMEEITSILYTSLPITMEDVENSKLGILLNDHNECLDTLRTCPHRKNMV